MKKIFITIGALAGLLVNAQVQVQSNISSSISKQNPFLDASNYNTFGNNIGKGLYFPSTNLKTWEFKTDLVNPGNFSNYFDGMIVYNTGEGAPTTAANVGGKRNNLERGFYYFKNPNQTFPGGSIENGEWVRISDAQANASLWAQRQVNGITETYLKPALDNNDFIGYRSDRKYQLNLGQVTESEGVLNTLQYYKPGQIPYSIAISSDVLLPQSQLELEDGRVLGITKRADFTQFNNVLRENYVAANSNVTTYIGQSTYLTSKDVNTPIIRLVGSETRADHYSDATLADLTSAWLYSTVGDETHTAVVENIRNIEATLIVNSGSTVDKSRAIASTIANYGTVNYMSGIENTIVSQAADENGIYPNHTMKSMKGMGNRVVVSPNATMEEDVWGKNSFINISDNTTFMQQIFADKSLLSIGENVTMADKKGVYGRYNSVSLASALPGNNVYVNRNKFELKKNGATAKNVFLNQSSINVVEPGASLVDNLFGFDFRNYNRGNWTVDNMYGVYLDQIVNGQTGNYGLFIDNVGNNNATNNYAIYTNDGKLRLGDLANSSATVDRVVTVDSDGVLKTVNSSAFSPIWVNETTDNVVKLAELSDGVTERTNEQNVFVTDDGKLGIGDPSPDKVTVKIVDKQNDPRIVLTNSGNDVLYDENNAVYGMSISPALTGSGNAYIDFHTPTSSTDLFRGLLFRGGNGPSEHFATRPIMALRSDNGRIGLGVLVPQAKLHVLSDNDNARVAQFSKNLSPSDNPNLFNQFITIRNSEIGVDFGIQTSSFDNSQGIALIKTGTDKGFAISVNNSNNFEDVNVADLYISPTSKNIGIATLTPTEKLEVAGAVKAESFKGTNGATIFPDYVFENYYTGTSTTKAEYSFKNLDQVEDYVKTNGHLPGYISAKEIKAQGYIDIMDTQLTNVEKIEELYLHTIEQDKAIKAKDAEIKELKSDVQELKSLVQQLLNK
ncbi:hypothetical protein KRX57_05610 [Weeksellaceae bacterium TAE3-ERU29]|nr:hypothetical protein [Weeksellaceae bacterium TAE3-ERU29]